MGPSAPGSHRPMFFEGITINKQPYKERDLIVKLLLRNGLVASFYVYGGQGGGKHYKPTAFEVGNMMKVQIKDRKSQRLEASDLMIVAEHQCAWAPQLIRHDVSAFYLMCLYFEIVQKFAVQYHPEQEFADDYQGIFNVMSNGLFYMDHSLANKQFIGHQHLTMFMVKLLHHLGIMPDTEHCGYCGTDLLGDQGASFLIEHGHFSCLGCVSGENEAGLLYRIRRSYQTKFADYKMLNGSSFQESDKLIQFFCHHFGLRPLELKTYTLLYK